MPEAPFTTLHGVGEKLAERLSARGLRNLSDALTFFPLDYRDSRIYDDPAVLDERRHVRLRVVLRRNASWFRGTVTTEATLRDEPIDLRWFNVPRPIGLSIARRFKKGQSIVIAGRPSRFDERWQIVHPEFSAELEKDADGRAAPRYPVIEGLSEIRVRAIVGEAVRRALDDCEDLIPKDVIARNDLMPLADALHFAHFPPLDADFASLLRRDGAPFRRLVFDELIYMRLALMARRRERMAVAGIALRPDDEHLTAIRLLEGIVPFELTRGQRDALTTIHEDLAQPHISQRLLQGDVGCGKTAVALGAALYAIACGHQVALLAPTTVLAEQHARNITSLVRDNANVALLVGAMRAKDRNHVLAGLALGNINLVIGTHALLGDDVRFRRLGLVIIDEQHRFGVEQRAALTSKGAGGPANLIAMSATPIPRSLALTVYGDLDLTVIPDKPAGRQPIVTRIIPGPNTPRIESAIARALNANSQIYIILPLVEETEDSDLRDATSYHAWAKQQFAPANPLLLHGKMPEASKLDALRAFAAGHSRILVATTVVEVGVDVPAARLIIIEHAERFGLAQLHQLRGRVGRDGNIAACLAVAYDPTPEGIDRLTAFERSHDGFALAEQDLAQRGPGDFFGSRQSGIPIALAFARLGRDADLFEAARREAELLFDADCEPAVRQRLMREALRRYTMATTLASAG